MYKTLPVRSHKQKKDRQHNDQMKKRQKDKQRWAVFYTSLFVLLSFLHLAIVLSVLLLFMASDWQCFIHRCLSMRKLNVEQHEPR
jgi:uncharacterized protein YqhQ